MQLILSDGGRAAAGFIGTTGDCVVRAVAIASNRPYREIYDALSQGVRKYEKHKAHRSARNGVKTNRPWFKNYMVSLGFQWVPTMHIGSGCTVHLRDGELPEGRLVVSVSKHYVAVINGVVHDIYNPSRDGTRCVYGYWQQQHTKRGE